MRSYLKTYKIKLTTLAPVFIGSGKAINQYEYIFDGKRVFVVDMNKFMSEVIDKGLTDKFYSFMQKRNSTLKEWAENSGLKDHSRYTAYELRGVQNIDDKRSLKAINLFIKNAYNEPYIPGSSMKGILRNIILWNKVYEDNKALDNIKKQIKEALSEKNVKKAMNRQTDILEKRYFSKRVEDKDLSVMRGIVISDSRPLSVDDLVVCQKVDLSTRGNEKKINTMRECLKPGLTVEFDLTIDETVFPYTVEELKRMIENYSNDYFDLILTQFKVSEDTGNVVYVGGGTGYFSKTITYSLFDYDDAVDIVSGYLKKTTPYVHKHEKDISIGISPHMQKCTSHNGKLYEMGKCRMEIE